MSRSHAGSHTDQPPKAIVQTAALGALALTVLGGAIFVLHRAWNMHGDDYWTVAFPGVATGAGTIVLAAVTVWLATVERMRADWLRVRADEKAQEARRLDETAYSSRESRKVVSVWKKPRSNGDDEEILIINAGQESILDVHLVEASFQPPASLANGVVWRWEPTLLLDQLNQDRSDAWHRPFVLAGASLQFSGKMQPDPRRSVRTTVDIEALVSRYYLITIAWTDSLGRYWLRRGNDEPEELARPFQESIRTQD